MVAQAAESAAVVAPIQQSLNVLGMFRLYFYSGKRYENSLLTKDVNLPVAYDVANLALSCANWACSSSSLERRCADVGLVRGFLAFFFIFIAACAVAYGLFGFHAQANALQGFVDLHHTHLHDLTHFYDLKRIGHKAVGKL